MTKKVLIVEDDESLMRGLRDNFIAAGYDVASAADGAMGLAHALTQSVDLMVLDIMLPRMNGYEVCRQVRASSNDVPILMLTAKGQEADIVRGLELGADDYVTKPFGVRELMARAKRLLGRDATTQQDDPSPRIGSFTFEILARRLVGDDATIELTQKESQLLEFFVHHADRALTRSTILDHVWGKSILVGPRSVDRCVTTLREKLAPHRCIQTIRGIGYRFEKS